MPTNVSDTAQQLQSGPGAAGGDILATDPGVLPEVQLARDLIACSREPQELPSPKMVDDAPEQLSPHSKPPLWLRNSLNLQAHYGGRAVACFQAPSGVVAVLAVGEEKIGELLKSLSDDEVSRIVIQYPVPLLACGTGEDGVAV